MVTLALIVAGVVYGIKRFKNWILNNPVQSMDIAAFFRRLFVKA